jgi:hypothetical protein
MVNPFLRSNIQLSENCQACGFERDTVVYIKIELLLPALAEVLVRLIRKN